MTDTVEIITELPDAWLVELNDFIGGVFPWSIKEPRCVALVRHMAETLHWTALQIGTRMGNFSKSKIISFCHRCAPPVVLIRPQGHVAMPKRRNSGNTLSTHLVRLQRKVEGDQPVEFDTEVDVSAAARRFAARMSARKDPRCLWHGCAASTFNSPYCPEHAAKAGIKPRMQFAKSGTYRD